MAKGIWGALKRLGRGKKSRNAEKVETDSSVSSTPAPETIIKAPGPPARGW